MAYFCCTKPWPIPHIVSFPCGTNVLLCQINKNKLILKSRNMCSLDNLPKARKPDQQCCFLNNLLSDLAWNKVKLMHTDHLKWSQCQNAWNMTILVHSWPLFCPLSQSIHPSSAFHTLNNSRVGCRATVCHLGFPLTNRVSTRAEAVLTVTQACTQTHTYLKLP